MSATGSSSGTFDRLRLELDRWFEAARVAGERTLDAVGLASESRPMPPATDVIETETDVHLLVDLPGVSADAVDLSLTGQVLMLKAIRLPSPLLTDAATIHLRERLTTSFERAIPLPVQVDADSVRAVVRDGQLHVTLKKSHFAQARQIPIQRGGDMGSPPPAL
ncbi:MAG: Hsp20/alpha crystallin family protein [Planctomycetaceae bacterium]|nr:Hsp20/alpha crystallin family protein [Planctomycetaceae bacterium]